MLITTTKISLAAVLSAIALLGGSAIASARTAVNGNHLPNSVVVVTQSHRDLPVVGGSTGQGTASESDCESAGDTVNHVLDQAQTELQTVGNTPRYYALLSIAQDLESAAEDDGCYFINPV